MPTEIFKLLMASMQFSDGIRAIRRDAKQVFDVAIVQDVDVICFTETVRGNRVFDPVRRQAKKNGWPFQRDIRGDVRLAANPKNEVLESNYVHVLDPQGGLRKGNYSARGIAELTLRTKLKNIATVHGAHWITEGGRANDVRAARRRLQSEMMVERVQLHGKGRRLSFWMGDTNEDEGRREGEVQRPLTLGGLTSIYDDLGKYPNTHGNSTIDVIGAYKRDGRVHPVGVRTFGNRGSDHLMVMGVYEISTPRKK